jgi:hypothetical protein
MFLAPINFATSFSLVPVFAWEPVEPPQPPPPPEPVACENPGLDQEKAQHAQDTLREMRLVFKGFAWTPGVHIQNFPEPSWMRGYASVGDDPNDIAAKHDDEDQERARKAALAHQHKAGPNIRATNEPVAPDVPTEPDTY